MANTVIVAFAVDDDISAYDAEALVRERLGSLGGLLQHNDSTDYQRGTQDRIQTYTVLSVAKALDEAL